MMQSFLIVLFLSVVCAVPQYKDLLKGYRGNYDPDNANEDYEQIPYKVIQIFDDYEERVYPSVRWACTEMTYKKSNEEISEREPVDERNVGEIIQKMMGNKEKPSSKMFLKLFR